MSYKILTGTASEVEHQLNELKKEFEFEVKSMSSTNEQTTVLVIINGSKKLLD